MMRKMALIFFVATILTSLFLLTAQQRGLKVVVKTSDGGSLNLYKQYRALVIGINDYLYWPRLPNAIKDAREVAAALEAMGFLVKLIENPTSEEIKSSLSNLVFRESGEEDGILLYFAGHGETMRLADGTDLGYIIPKDCPLQKSDAIGFTKNAISMEDIQTYSLQLKSKHLLAVFDSCFSGSIFTLERAAPADISYKTVQPVRQYITAGSAEESVPDRSIFKECFLEGMKGEADANEDGYITGSELGMYLESKVVNYTRSAQHPQYGKIRNPKLDKGDFVFVMEKASTGGSFESQVLPKPPVKSELDLSDIRKSAEGRETIKKDWENWQAEMQAAFNEVEGIDRSAIYSKEEKKAAWERFLRSYDKENPFSSEDEELRQTVQLRIIKLSPGPGPAQASQKLADSKPVIQARVTLRSSPGSLTPQEEYDMLQKRGFFDRYMNTDGDFTNDYELKTINRDKVVLDLATGLMWHQSGSEAAMTYDEAKKWIDELNHVGYAGYKDWRLPTLEEAASLIENKKMDENRYVDPKFSAKQDGIWTSDLGHGSGSTADAWIVTFRFGGVNTSFVFMSYYVRPVRSGE